MAQIRVYALLAMSKPGPLSLQLADVEGQRPLLLEGPSALGRDLTCAVRLSGPGISRRHGRFELREDGWYHIDTQSQNGSRLNGELLKADEARLLRTGDVLSIASTTCQVISDGRLPTAERQVASEATVVFPEETYLGSGEETISAGRAIDNEIVLSDPYVSGRHLEAWLHNGALFVRDLDSTNGTFLGDARFTEGAVPSDAVLRLGSQTMLQAQDLIARLRAGLNRPCISSESRSSSICSLDARWDAASTPDNSSFAMWTSAFARANSWRLPAPRAQARQR